jgi:hypothetical protein
LAQLITLAQDCFDLLLVDFEELAGLELHDTLLEVGVLPLQLPNRLLELLSPRQVDFS